MKYNTQVEAIQLTKKDEFFAGVEVKTTEGKKSDSEDNEVFAVLNINGAATIVKENDWLVTYQDETQEVLSNKEFKKLIGGTPVEVGNPEVTEQETKMVAKL